MSTPANSATPAISANSTTAPPPTGEQWLALGRALHGAGRHGEAVNALQRAAAQLPLDVEVYRALVASLDASGQVADAASARIGIDAIERRRAVDLFEIGRVYARHKQWDAAGHWLERALMIDAGLHAAHICMAWVLRQLGMRHGSGRQACRAYRGQAAFAAARRNRRRTVLIVCSSGFANVPFRHLVPPALNRVVRWVIDLGVVGIGWGRAGALPPHDIAFNVVGDADLGAFCRAELAQFAETSTAPVLNQPARIERTTRERIGALLDGIAGIYAPTTCRWAGASAPADALHAAIAAAGMAYPVITRPAGEHGGKGVVLLTSPADTLAQPPAGDMYLTAYHEYRSADGYYRKYRVIFIDREPYPYHLAIGRQWLLHYFSADMLSESWKLEEERRFLEDPRTALGAPAWAALRAIGERMDLDYCGIDFSLLPDGRVLVFEANATMLVHPEVEDDGLRFKNAYIQKIFDALDGLMQRRIAAPDQAART
ncbi:tetratricopeptide repeat protein [Bordetella genomosp. 9]|uniref:tetratricopeptide repeat protein n=1 Tax=Bordetella genomosp. 9 TaxID=1416803 RepID=UPI0011776BAA|nr:tetratricopeptide repeat protein [Bordetella genomosp. 9]